jgi:heptaprenyl diphosphate synthase
VTPSRLAQAVDSQHIFGQVSQELRAVEQSIRHITLPEVSLLAEALMSAVSTPGKLMRPSLVLLSGGATGTIQAAHIEAGAVAELIHLATLLHDDVLDDADLRRGQPTVKAAFGNQIAILSGDYLLAQASLKLSQLNNCRLVSIFSIVLGALCAGEVQQAVTAYNIEASWENYYKKSNGKTAALFAACCEAAAVINQLAEHEVQQHRLYGEKLGLAFQVIDDLLDYTAKQSDFGKPVLDDLKNGLLNAPALLALEYSPNRQGLQELIQRLWKAEGASEDLEALILDQFQSSHAFEKTKQLAENLIQEACDCLSPLPHSPYKTGLQDLAQYVLERSY